MRKICIVTTTRAEYGIMSRLIDMMDKDEDIELQLIVSGSHLSEKFGMTVNEIKQSITKKIDIQIEKEPYYSVSIAVKEFSETFNEIKPDIAVILGDRYEIQACAQACMLNNIPIAHIHGGETTQGAMDEAIRHSITKMSHLHFPSCEIYRKRIIQLGENPNRVFNVGALGVENIKKVPLFSKDELEKSLEFDFKEKNFLITFHPVTLEGNSSEQFIELLNALNEFKNCGMIFTAPNSDKGNDKLFSLINNFVSSHSNAKIYKSLGICRYFSAIKYCDAVIGNSSSGIIEVPSFKKPTVNIGNRQKGRVQAQSVINCEPVCKEIINSINIALSNDFSNTVNPYEKNNTAENILKVLKCFPLKNILFKEFYDLPL